MTLTYIYHDCFVLETARCRFVFDYWREPESADGSVLRLLKDDPKPTLVLVSHHHKDHFSKEIFAWKDVVPHIHYILSKDTAKFARHYITPQSRYCGPLKTPPEMVSVLRPGDILSWQDVDIYAFDSTDTGNSYLLNVDGKWAFHAGDLNAWTLREQNTRPQIDAAIRDFKACITPIREVAPAIDIAMFPLDPRTGSGWLDGAEIFLSTFDVSTFVPMHYCLADSPVQLQQFIDHVQQACSDLSIAFPSTKIRFEEPVAP